MLVNIQEKPTLQSPKIGQIQQIAKTENATLVEYSVIPDKSLYIWVVTPQGKITFRKADLKSLGTLLKEFVAELRESIPRSRANNVQLQKLHQLLIKPIADLLPKNPSERIVFMPREERRIMALYIPACWCVNSGNVGRSSGSTFSFCRLIVRK